MAKNEDRNFCNVGQLTAAINEQVRKLDVTHTSVDRDNAWRINSGMLIFQVQTQLAIAQQLSVISGTLKDLLVLCKSQSKD